MCYKDEFKGKVIVEIQDEISVNFLIYILIYIIISLQSLKYY